MMDETNGNRPHRRARRRWIMAAAATALVAVVAGCASTATSATSSTSTSTSSPSSSAPKSMGNGSNARSGPAEGGSIGTVGSMSSSGFTLTTATGEKVTVTGAPATSGVTNGELVEVIGTVNSTTITASQIIANPTAGQPAQTFQRGASSTAKQVGQIPSNYTEGSGTIMTGTTADKATEAALASYSGGIVDRVVQLSGGEYEVHYIGANWPHHIFVNQQFQVVGAD